MTYFVDARGHRVVPDNTLCDSWIHERNTRMDRYTCLSLRGGGILWDLMDWDSTEIAFERGRP